MKIATHLYLVLQLRICGGIPPLTHMSAWLSALLSTKDNFAFTW
jgi:hypothetical protein